MMMSLAVLFSVRVRCEQQLRDLSFGEVLGVQGLPVLYSLCCVPSVVNQQHVPPAQSVCEQCVLVACALCTWWPA